MLMSPIPLYKALGLAVQERQDKDMEVFGNDDQKTWKKLAKFLPHPVILSYDCSKFSPNIVMSCLVPGVGDVKGVDYCIIVEPSLAHGYTIKIQHLSIFDKVPPPPGFITLINHSLRRLVWEDENLEWHEYKDFSPPPPQTKNKKE